MRAKTDGQSECSGRHFLLCAAIRTLTCYPAVEETLQQRIHCNAARAKDEYEQCCKPVSVRSGVVEIAWARKNVAEIHAVIGNAEVGDGHVDEQDERNQARADTESKENAADEFNQGDEQSGRSGSRQIEIGEIPLRGSGV
jgi:hypothetical protein